MALRAFLGLSVPEATPDHSTISRNYRLIEVETQQEVFACVLVVLGQENLLKAQGLGLDAPSLEANAAMKSIVHREAGEGYSEFLQRLARESGKPTPKRTELARKNKKRKGKGSNDDWTSSNDPDARITRMKDGSTHLAHKAEHAVDLETGAIVAVTVQPVDRGGTQSFQETLSEALEDLGAVAERASFSQKALTEVIANRGYYIGTILTGLQALALRSYIAEPKRPRRRWKSRSAEQKSTYAIHRRNIGSRGKSLSKWCSEWFERSMANCYETGGMCRVRLPGRENFKKRVLAQAAGFNLGLVMRKPPAALEAQDCALVPRLASKLSACAFRPLVISPQPGND